MFNEGRASVWIEHRLEMFLRKSSLGYKLCQLFRSFDILVRDDFTRGWILSGYHGYQKLQLESPLCLQSPCAYNIKFRGMGILWASVQCVCCKCICPHTILHNWQNLCLPTSKACSHSLFLICQKTKAKQKLHPAFNRGSVLVWSLRLLAACRVTKFKEKSWS